MKIGIGIGHELKSKGASNTVHKISEYDFNDALAKLIKPKLELSGFDVELIYRLNGYTKLPSDINKANPDIYISLHCNAFNSVASGCEMLFAKGSKNGERLAKICQKFVVEALGNNDRGVKVKVKDDRGGHELFGTKMPAIIVEPFFIDNNEEYLNAVDKIDELTNAIVKTCIEYRG